MKIPKAEPIGEATLAFHLQCNNVAFVREYPFAAQHGRKWRADFFVAPDVLIEVDGGVWSNGRHNRGAGYTEDCEKMNFAVVHGYKVLRFTTEQVTSGKAIDTVMQCLR